MKIDYVEPKFKSENDLEKLAVVRWICTSDELEPNFTKDETYRKVTSSSWGKFSLLDNTNNFYSTDKEFRKEYFKDVKIDID